MRVHTRCHFLARELTVLWVFDSSSRAFWEVLLRFWHGDCWVGAWDDSRDTFVGLLLAGIGVLEIPGLCGCVQGFCGVTICEILVTYAVFFFLVELVRAGNMHNEVHLFVICASIRSCYLMQPGSLMASSQIQVRP